MTDIQTAPLSTEALVRRYLTTVVVIDDQATYEPPPMVPDGGEAVDGVVVDGAAHAGLVAPVKAHRLDAADVANAFGCAGIVCSILKPPGDIDVEELAAAAISRADVVILDWDLVVGETTGVTATKIIRRLTESAGIQPVRLVCIYTVDAPQGIAAGIASSLNGVERDPFTVDIGLTRISVLGKELNTNCPPDRSVPFDGLPDRVVAEFTAVVAGLTSGFAVAALGAVRDNSGRLLTRFHDGIDPGLLGHRMLIPHGDDAHEQVLDAMADELKSVLEADDLVQGSLSSARCLARSKVIRPDDAGLKALSTEFHADPQGLLDKLIEDGVGDEEAAKKAKWATKTHASKAEAARADLDFAELLYGRSHYSGSAPPLALGVIVEKCEDGHGLSKGYYLCVQPVCDSVRVKASRSFPLVRLREAFGEPFSFVVRDRGQSVPLRANVKLHDLQFVAFPPDATAEAVIATATGEDLSFTASDGDCYRFVTRLRDVMAQRVAHQIGNLVSRVGANDLEAQRFGWPAPAKQLVAPQEPAAVAKVAAAAESEVGSEAAMVALVAEAVQPADGLDAAAEAGADPPVGAESEVDDLTVPPQPEPGPES